MSQTNFKHYFGFLSEPFSKELKAAALFMSASLTALKQYLTQHLSRRGNALITSDVGSGKTTAVRAFVEALDKTQYDVVYIEDPTIGLRNLAADCQPTSSQSPVF